MVVNITAFWFRRRNPVRLTAFLLMSAQRKLITMCNKFLFYCTVIVMLQILSLCPLCCVYSRCHYVYYHSVCSWDCVCVWLCVRDRDRGRERKREPNCVKNTDRTVVAFTTSLKPFHNTGYVSIYGHVTYVCVCVPFLLFVHVIVIGWQLFMDFQEKPCLLLTFGLRTLTALQWSCTITAVIMMIIARQQAEIIIIYR